MKKQSNKTKSTPEITFKFKPIHRIKRFKKGDWVYREYKLFQITGINRKNNSMGLIIYDISNGNALTSFNNTESDEVFKQSIDIKCISEWFRDWHQKISEVHFINQNRINDWLKNKWVDACNNPKSSNNIYEEVMEFYRKLSEHSSEIQSIQIYDVFPFSRFNLFDFN